jgi:hypothetical protein
VLSKFSPSYCIVQHTRSEHAIENQNMKYAFKSAQ